MAAFFRDTIGVSSLPQGARNFDLRIPAQRDSLRAVLRRERGLWRAASPRDYRFVLRVGCFCPGTRGWLLIEVRTGQPLKAWDTRGTAVPLSDWNTVSVEGLFDNLDKSIDRPGTFAITFDPRWHFPNYVRTVGFPGPDMWATYDARGLSPL